MNLEIARCVSNCLKILYKFLSNLLLSNDVRYSQNSRWMNRCNKTWCPFGISDYLAVMLADAYGSNRRQLPNILDNMIHYRHLPVMIAVMVANCGGDGGGSERGLKYDTVSSKFAEFAEAEIRLGLRKSTGSP